MLVSPVARPAAECADRGGQARDGLCEDDRHNAGHVDLDGQVRVLATIDLTADNALGVLDRDAALSLGNENDEDDDREHGDDQQQSPVPEAAEVGLQVVEDRRDDAGRDARDDVGEQDHRDAVADAVLGDLITQPHDQRGAGREGQDDDESSQEAGAREEHVAVLAVVVAEHDVIGKAHQDAQTNRRVARDLRKLLLTLFAALFAQTLESRNGDGKKLNDDGRVDIRLNRQCEDGGLREGRAGHHIEQAEDGVAQLLAEHQGHLLHVDTGNGNDVADAVQKDDHEREEELSAQLRDLPGIADGSKHLHHLSLSTCLFDFRFGRSGKRCCFHSELLSEIAIGEDLQAVLAVTDDALLRQGSGVDHCTVLKDVELAEVHGRQRLCKDVIETTLRDASCQRHLAAFEADTDLTAGTGLLTLVTATSRLAVAGAGAATLALANLGRTRDGSKFM